MRVGAKLTEVDHSDFLRLNYISQSPLSCRLLLRAGHGGITVGDPGSGRGAVAILLTRMVTALLTQPIGVMQEVRPATAPPASESFSFSKSWARCIWLAPG